MENIIMITTTTDKKDAAEEIGRGVVEKRLAACAQIVGPIKSVYRWKGNVEEAQEWQCVIKTRESHYDEIEKEILRLHSYELPEITIVPIKGGLEAYAEWVREETSP